MSGNAQPAQQSDLSAMDVEEYKQKRRIERILDAHDNVEDKYDLILEEVAMGNLSTKARDIILLHQVQHFIRECYNVLLDYANGLREEQDDGNPDEPNDRFWFGEPRDPIGRIEFEHDEDEIFWGLRDVLQANDIYSTTYTLTEQPKNKPPREATVTESKTVPPDVSWEAYLRLKEFLSQHRGLDLKFEETGRPLSNYSE